MGNPKDWPTGVNFSDKRMEQGHNFTSDRNMAENFVNQVRALPAELDQVEISRVTPDQISLAHILCALAHLDAAKGRS